MLLLGRLAVHYYRPDFTPEMAKLLIEDMADDLERFTFFQVEQAIKAYRQDGKNKFFPKSGELCAEAERMRSAEAQLSKPVAVRGPEFGDHRPLNWELQPKAFWKRHWHEDDLKRASDPQRYARYMAWKARRESSDAT